MAMATPSAVQSLPGPIGRASKRGNRARAPPTPSILPQATQVTSDSSVARQHMGIASHRIQIQTAYIYETNKELLAILWRTNNYSQPKSIVVARPMRPATLKSQHIPSMQFILVVLHI
jgi:hypothetical protein